MTILWCVHACHVSFEVELWLKLIPQETSKENILLSDPDIVFEALPQEMKKRIKAIRCHSEPVNILVVGQTGVAMSSLVNALMGDIVAEVHYGAKSVTAEMNIHEGAFMGMSIQELKRVDDDIPRKKGEEISSCSILNVKFYNYM